MGIRDREEGVKLRLLAISSAVALLSAAGAASAQSTVKQLGGGWQVFIPDINVVDVVLDNFTSNGNIRIIQKFAVINDFSALDLVFTQIAPNAQTATRFAITDEFVLNNSGQAWSGFDISLVNQTNGSATFNVADSASLSFGPFATRTYSGGNTVASFTDGTVNPGDFWLPGVSAGALWIDVVLNPADSRTARTSFTLREQAVPSAGSAALAALGLLAAGRRRR
jgi:opacity protein-like surface antigen